MGSKCSTIQLEEDDVMEISKETGFSARQIKRLYSRFSNLDRGNLGKLRREDFFRIPELAINPLGERIVQSFFAFKDKDEAEDIGVNFKEFVRTLAYFRPIRKKKENAFNTTESKLEFAFRIYDIDGDGYISRQELLDLLRMMVGVNISEEQLGSIADMTLSEADDDKDGFISFTEFSKQRKDFLSFMRTQIHLKCSNVKLRACSTRGAKRFVDDGKNRFSVKDEHTILGLMIQNPYQKIPNFKTEEGIALLNCSNGINHIS